MNTIPKPLPPALPATVQDFMSHRKVKTKRTLNDQVEEIHLLMVEDEEYSTYLYAVWDEQAVEGSLTDDQHKAAELIRDRAKKLGSYPEVQAQKIATIKKALNVVLRRFGQSRKERRYMIGGETIVPDENGD